MKKILILMLVLAMLVSAVSCGKKNFQNTDTTSQENKTTETESKAETELEEDTGKRWIGNRSVQFNEADNEYVLFFSFSKTETGSNYISENGVVNVVIKDESDYTIYEKDIEFSEEDFSDWTNSSWDSSRYMCGVYIPRDDIEGSSSSSGVLTMNVSLSDGSSFSAHNLTIYDLPPLTVDMELPAVPVTYIDDDYSYDQTLEVQKIEYKTESVYDGEASVSLEVKVKLISKTDRVNESSSVHIGYKLYDSEGIVVDSGQLLGNPIAVGEITKASTYISDLDPRDHYKLVLSNAG